MNNIQPALRHQLQSLFDLLHQLDDYAYTYASPLLSHSTIGHHIRHTIELLQCLHQGYEKGIIDYDSRKRDRLIETDKLYAAKALEHLLQVMPRPDRELLLEGCYDTGENAVTRVVTTFNRELVYNIEHIIHHMALIKVALKEMQLDLVTEEFGVAYATVQYRKQCAQ